MRCLPRRRGKTRACHLRWRRQSESETGTTIRIAHGRRETRMAAQRIMQIGALTLAAAGLMSEIGSFGSATAVNSSRAKNGVGYGIGGDSRGGSELRQLQSGEDAATVIADGAASPESVSDALAFRHFVATVLMRRAAATDEARRQRLRLAPVGLNEADRESFLLVVRLTGETLDQLANQRRVAKAGGYAGGALLSRLKEQEVQAFEYATQRLRETLSTEGFRQLEAHLVTHVKPHVKVYASTR